MAIFYDKIIHIRSVIYYKSQSYRCKTYVYDSDNSLWYTGYCLIVLLKFVCDHLSAHYWLNWVDE